MIEKLGECFGLHRLVTEDLMSVVQRPKVEDYGEYLFVVVKMLTYDFLRYGTIEGHLASVSASSFIDDKGTPYFKGIVRLNRAHLGAGPNDFPVLPGMTVVCDIVTDRKSVLQYLARPVVVAFRQGLRER